MHRKGSEGNVRGETGRVGSRNLVGYGAGSQQPPSAVGEGRVGDVCVLQLPAPQKAKTFGQMTLGNAES